MKQSISNDVLDTLAMFTVLSAKERISLLSGSQELTVPAGRVLMVEGSPGAEVMVLLEGSARVEVMGHTVGVVGSGELIGELAVIDHGVRSATVTTTRESRVLIIGAREFSQAVERSPQFARRVLREVSLRLRSLDQSLVAN